MIHLSRCTRFLLLGILFCALLLACRTANLIMGTGARPPPTTAVAANKIASRTPTRFRAARTPPTAEPLEAPTDTPKPTEIPPVETSQRSAPTVPPSTKVLPTPVPRPTQARPPTRVTGGSGTRPDTPTITATPEPTRCPYKYCAVYRGCQPDPGNTIIEGIVYNNGVPENGVVVRVALQQGAYPIVDDFLSGTDPINPGRPDPNNPGRYFLQISPGAVRAGTWWVFIVDRINGTVQISEGAMIRTDAEANSPTSCQHAFVDFVR